MSIFIIGIVDIEVRLIDALTIDQQKKLLIMDKSTYNRSGSKVVELLAWAS